ncbi:MAG: hypothetical protein H7A25_23400 [Leptospiraceae bacterium]|nr:hypothetical protein [Leptospiraceae bacterium]MCP5502866.1 hypothetical protein [Leptospiraceae bacterium]
MAKVKRNLLGEYSGKAGNIVFAYGKGKTTFRSRVEEMTAEPSDSQKVVRNKFTVLARMGGILSDVTRIGYDKNTHRSPQSFFVQENYNFLIEEPDNVSLDLSKLVLSKGSLPNLPALSKEILTNSINYTWVYNNYGKREDEVFLIALNQLEENTLIAKSNRGTEKISMDIPEQWFGDDIYFYYFCLNAKTNKKSKNYFLGVEKFS